MSKKDKETADTLPPPAAAMPAAAGFVVDDSPEGVERLRSAGFTVTTDTAPGVLICTDAANPVRLFNGDSVEHMAGGVFITKKAPDA